ncbi:hypothetical protein ACFQ5J_02640 [Lacticaseibacillus baoqingensis]|uniref:Antibiotic biosynthesis monooxygenase n=1 Tax=Lacticaseibacillus baoqingensis TaxID=2486013 RepID=A0ABW4E6R0_9LACO|nr:hypothetical protein [Lacticaseibacillus baoqingensis]
MSNNMQMILGSRYFLKQFFTKTDAPLLLLKPLNEGSNYALLDYTAAVPFVAPMKFKPLAQAGQLVDQGFLQLSYFRLNEQEAPVFVAKAKKLFEHRERLRGNQALYLFKTDAKAPEYVLLSQWEKTLDLFASKKTPLMAPILDFTQRAAKGLGYHEAYYQIVSPDAEDEPDDQSQLVGES